MHLLKTAFLYSLGPVAAAAIGTLIVFLRTPTASVRSAVQHFAAGVVFSVVAVELLPDIRRQHAPIEVLLGFVIGIALMLLLRSVSARLERRQDNAAPGFPFPLLAAIGIDVLIDGFLVGVGLRAGHREGMLLTIALSTEFLSLGLAITLELLERQFSRSKTFSMVMGTCSLMVIGAVAGTGILTVVSAGMIQLVLSAGLAALLFLVTEELLVEAHEVEETPAITASFFLGFVLFLMMDMTDGS
jgi:ZIP family zinc transporter